MKFENLPIQKKLTRFTLLLSATILMVTGAIFFIYDYVSLRNATIEKLSTIGKIIATNSTAALTFQSKEDADDVIRAISAESDIVSVAIYDEAGKLFSFYPKESELKMGIEGLLPYQYDIRGEEIQMYLPISQDDKTIGTLHLKYQLNALKQRMGVYAIVGGVSILVSLLLVIVFSKRLKRNITIPILNLMRTALNISREKDYSIRAPIYYDDEVGKLTKSFNNMVGQIETQNSELSSNNIELQRKAEELEQASKYKSEFLANMSHELRSPLNSLLILANDLCKNRSKTFNEEELESVRIIHESGTDLLSLINDILDLSKIEAGKMEANFEKTYVNNVVQTAKNSFKALANKKGLDLNLIVQPGVPDFIISDSQRLNQILKNLLSNALKFTNQGSVSLVVERHQDDVHFSVTDTGIGIPKSKQGLIFEAFKQAEGGTARRYGGTGLGLSIATQLSELLGGHLELESEEGKGSTFKLVLEGCCSEDVGKRPVKKAPSKPKVKSQVLEPEKVEQVEELPKHQFRDDREDVSDGEEVILIIEDDSAFAKILMKEANEIGRKAVCAASGEEGLKLLNSFNVLSIILDIKLPGISGLAVLGELKSSSSLRHIPVSIISALHKEDTPIKGSVLNYLTKPVQPQILKNTFQLIENYCKQKIRLLLVVEDDQNVRHSLNVLLKSDNLEIVEAESVSAATKILKDKIVDCIILDLTLTDGSGVRILEYFNESQRNPPPIIVYTGADLDREEIEDIKHWAETVIIKGKDSESHILSQTAMYLHQPINTFKSSRKDTTEVESSIETDLTGKRVLVVDDDMRNIFALSNALRSHGLEVFKAESGPSGIRTLEENPEIDVVLMDIMMPDMDGYEAIGLIRSNPDFKNKPIIALTAKAMSGDREKCLQAGASDYFAKPVDIDKLLKLLSIWMN
ncbi:response regulator [Luteibaculum oceani]|uniref:histidine kinase n=1 Tax=Luteibaculum oceani TaxID=1294296 RepID=A0A5C6V882_9FLAO|nr:response regulator [Luteibaculum oceani]TXC81552.1 response regulator [Luteibaculum oceani]